MMRFSTRASARPFGIATAATATVLSLTGASGAHSVVPLQEDVFAAQVQLADGYEVDATRIEAPPAASFAVDKPDVKIKPKPKVTSNFTPYYGNPSQAVSGAAVVAYAKKFIGTPYLSGGSTPKGFDCSGFVSYVYSKFGISLPRSSGAYYSVGTRVSRKNAKPGDLIVSPGHVGIYVGHGMQIDSPRPGKTIQVRGIWQSNPIFVRVTK